MTIEDAIEKVFFFHLLTLIINEGELRICGIDCLNPKNVWLKRERRQTTMYEIYICIYQA